MYWTPVFLLFPPHNTDLFLVQVDSLAWSRVFVFLRFISTLRRFCTRRFSWASFGLFGRAGGGYAVLFLIHPPVEVFFDMTTGRLLYRMRLRSSVQFAAIGYFAFSSPLFLGLLPAYRS